MLVVNRKRHSISRLGIFEITRIGIEITEVVVRVRKIWIGSDAFSKCLSGIKVRTEASVYLSKDIPSRCIGISELN